MKTKRVLCLCLTVCLVLPLMSLLAVADGAFAGRSAEFGDRVIFLDNIRGETGKVYYTSGAIDSQLNTMCGLERYSPTASGYGVELHGKDWDGWSGYWGINFGGWNYNASTDQYFSIHYQVKNATNTGIRTADATCNNGNNNPVHLKITMDIQNDVWKTYSVRLGDHLIDNDGNPTTAEFWPADGNDYWGLALPALEGENAYYIIDYVGIFADAESAANEAAYWESFHAGKPLPHAAKASVAAGAYEAVQSVTLTSATAGAEIYYTLDGTAPTKTATRYSQAISVAADATLKTVAYDPATDRYSPVCSYTYEINLNIVAAPVFDLKGGCIPAGKSLTITTKTQGAEIHYTTDGSDPTADSPRYTAPIAITGKMTVKAIAVKAGMDSSTVASVAFGGLVPSDIYWSFSGLSGGSADGSMTQVQGVYHTDRFRAVFGSDLTNDAFGGVVRTVSKDVAENAIRIESYYFVDPNEGMPNGYHRYMALTYKCPVDLQLEYHPDHYNNGARSQKITLKASETYKTVVIDLYENSETWADWVGDSNFTLQFFYDGAEATSISILGVSFHETEENANKGKVAAPNASVATSEKYTETISVELVSATEGAQIYYTTDGSTPSAATGTRYSGPISISKDTVLKAIAVKDGSVDSLVMTFDYKVTLTVAQPNPSLAGGKYEGNQTVTVTCATGGAKLYYTLDGSTPSAENGTLYTGAITLTKSCILKVIAVMEGRADSKVVSRTYNITGGGDVTVDTGSEQPTGTGTAAPTAPEKAGCSSAIGANALILAAVLSLAGVAVRRKKES